MKEIIINTNNVSVLDLVEGIKILLKYDPDSNIAAFHDVVYFCGYEEISEDDFNILSNLGWRFDSSVDSWKYST